MCTFKVVISPDTICELVDHEEVEDNIDTEQDEEHEVEIQKLGEMLLEKARRSSNAENKSDCLFNPMIVNLTLDGCRRLHLNQRQLARPKLSML